MKRQTWLVTGSTGLVGRALTQLLLDQGQVVHTLDRKKRKRLSPDHHAFAWPKAPDSMDDAIAQGVDVVVHLAGASVGQRWTRSHKEAILRSRVEGTTALMKFLNEASFAGTILQASAIGLYEPSEHPMDEQGPTGSSFLADVVRRWEQAANDNQPQGSRLVFLRLGIVLAPKGGTLDKLAPIYRMGLGAPLASGRQWMSWIALDDVLRVMQWCVSQPSIRGAVNVVAPDPVRNAGFSQSLAQAMKRPHLAPRVPGWALRSMFGEMASVMLDSQRVTPSVLLKHGFQWTSPDLQETFERFFR